LKISSTQQFRSYILGWFLSIVGLIVIGGGIIIYKSANDYVLGQFKKSQVAQIRSMANLINASQHEKIVNQYSSDLTSFKTLSNSFSQALLDSGDGNQIFSLNYASAKKTLQYAVNPKKAEANTIKVTLPGTDILVVQSKDKEIKLIYLDQFVESYVIKELNYQVELVKSNQSIQLMINKVSVLTLEPSNKEHFIGKIANKQINSKNPSVDYPFDVGNDKILVKYRWVKLGQVIYFPGDTYHAPSRIYQKFLSKIENNTTPPLIRAENFESDIISNKVKNNPKGFYISAAINNGLKNINKLRSEVWSSVVFSLSMLIIGLMIAAMFFAKKVTMPLEELTQAIQRLIRNDFNFKLSTKKVGHLDFLAAQFNLMLSRIQKSRNELIHLNKAYSRFIPHQLLKQLSHEGVEKVSLGDSCERQMTVLFCDIRGFTRLSESMSPEKNFKFINHYLNQIAPVINKYGGIIDKYMGDGIMAIFPNSADDALGASIEMLSSLAQYNKNMVANKLPSVELGLGLHTGKVMMGTVGTSSRMDATVISDAVNVASRVESMTKAFSTKILITSETKNQLKNINDYKIRYIANCRVPGKTNRITLYEVFNNDPLSLQKEKLQNQSSMIKAWKIYTGGDHEKAVELYQKLIEKSPHDQSLFALIERCQSGRL